MDRDALGAYLNAWFAELIGELELDLDPVLNAVAAIYAAQTELPATWANHLADYYLFKRADMALDVEMDVTFEDGDSYKRNQLHANVQAGLSAAYAKVSWLVDPEIPVELANPNLGNVVAVISPAMSDGTPWSW